MKCSEENFVFEQVCYKYAMSFEWEMKGGLVGVGAYLTLSLSAREVGWGWALIRGWALINFFCLQDGRLFEVDANSRLGAYSNKYGMSGTHMSMVTSIASDKSRQLRGLGLGLDFLHLDVPKSYSTKILDKDAL